MKPREGRKKLNSNFFRPARGSLFITLCQPKARAVGCLLRASREVAL
ncbi:MAG TPA: hypothetical protein VF735_00485 [Pyrinomonadaceae bacterium]